MIGHNTRMRDWLSSAQAARIEDIGRGISRRSPPLDPELKRRRDEAEQRRQLRELIGADPY
ncbi:hypothetical protein AAFM71_07560 [Chromobacterium violaceum]|uniref:Uncharacterized protein n=1 Tax=Chromobacterium violaceum TaxID=536 RepID=A0A202B5B0_CHRVL|nr:hypothetical protein [Chromobacterium violaceum]OVE46714.1 hypothetical protein CBW21_17620 [Chromobacterium violaceum]